jgi:dTDP-4-amino-4,6-dideoxygalactose transaminase
MVYNPWPTGDLPPEFRRPEIEMLRQTGVKFDDPREIIEIFEKKIADYAGSKFAAVLDCASNGIFLSLKYLENPRTITIPSKTYISVPMQILHAGHNVKLEEREWSGVYNLAGTSVFDGAGRFHPGMYLGEDAIQVLSFQIKKRLPIGRGGAVLTNDRKLYEWIKLASYDGRDLKTPYDSRQHIKSIGWHMYMTPEDAARGLLLMEKLGTKHYEDVTNSDSYPSLIPWLKDLGIV